MKKHPNDSCCNGCQNGKPGTNPTCQAKLMMQKIKESQGSEATNFLKE